jgi:hypothetical protein
MFSALSQMLGLNQSFPSYVQDGGNEFPHEGISFSAGKYKMIYSQQKRADGGVAGNVSGGWDLTTNKVYA